MLHTKDASKLKKTEIKLLMLLPHRDGHVSIVIMKHSVDIGRVLLYRCTHKTFRPLIGFRSVNLYILYKVTQCQSSEYQIFITVW